MNVITKKSERLRIPLGDIELATDSFSAANHLGRGGFGSVYKGEFLNSITKTKVTAAVKRLDQRSYQGNTEFWKEVTILSDYKHENIVSLLGFCDERNEKILVYEFASKKSLDLCIESDDLDWIKRLQICLGAARGLEYLHRPNGTQQRIIHRDIKSSNILLFENWTPKISDFGLSRSGSANQPNSLIVTGPVGTLAYCDPVYANDGFLTKESDVYSFGVVLFEVLRGRLCFTGSDSERWLFIESSRHCVENGDFKEIVYDHIKSEINPNSLKAFATIACRCLKRACEDRPTMTEVVNELKIALGHQSNTYTPLEDALFDDHRGLGKLKSFEAELRYDFGKLLFGCKHYRNRCKLRAPCCDRIFPCHRCHDEYTSELQNPNDRHQMVSRDVNQVICTICNTKQLAVQICGNCGAKMGEYFCKVCKLYDDDTSKGQFHCDDCGICDGLEHPFHCHAWSDYIV